MSNDSFKSRFYRLLALVGYSGWTLMASFYLPGLLLNYIFMTFYRSGYISESLIDRPETTLIFFALQYMIGLSILLILPRMIQKLSNVQLRELLGITRRPQLKDAGYAVGIFIFYLYASSITVAIFQQLFPGINLEQAQNVGFNNVADVFGLVAAFVSLVILAPVAEELIFRGYLFGNLRRIAGVTTGAVVTSILFGYVHGQWNVGIDVAVLSIFLCVLRVKTGSIWAGIFLHMTKNGLAYFFLFIAPMLGIQLQ